MNRTKKQILSILILVVTLGWYGVIRDWSWLSSDNVRYVLFCCTIFLALSVADAAYTRIFKSTASADPQQPEKPTQSTLQHLGANPVPLLFVAITLTVCLWTKYPLQQLMRSMYAGSGSDVKYLLCPDQSLGNAITAALILLLTFAAHLLIGRFRNNSEYKQPDITPYNPLLSLRANAVAIAIVTFALLTYITTCTLVTGNGIGSRIALKKSFHEWESVREIEEIHEPVSRGKGRQSCDKFILRITFSDHTIWTSRDITYQTFSVDKTYDAVYYASERSGVKIELVSRYGKEPWMRPEL